MDSLFVRGSERLEGRVVGVVGRERQEVKSMEKSSLSMPS